MRRFRAGFNSLISLTVAVVAAIWASGLGADSGGALHVDRLSVEDGLSQTTVWAVLQDSRGFIWMGTEEGLNRHDGYQFKIFAHDPEDPKTLGDFEVQSLCEDPEGDLWIGTSGGGLDRFVRADETFIHHRNDPEDPTSLSNDNVLSLAVDTSGTLWVGTENGLNRHRGDGTFERFFVADGTSEDPGLNKVWNILVDHVGALWVATDHGLHRDDPTGERFQTYRQSDTPPSLPSDRVYAVAEGTEGEIWLGMDNGLCRFDRRLGRCTATSLDSEKSRSWPQGPINSLLVDQTGDLWVGTVLHGLFQYSPALGEFQAYRHQPADPYSLSDDSIISLHEDHSGTLWIGTYVGVNKYDRTRAAFTTYRHRPGEPISLSSNSIWALYQSRNGELWVGTYNHGLNRFDQERRKVSIYTVDPDDPKSLPNGAINALFEDRSGFLWVGTWGGLSRFDSSTEHFTTWKSDPQNPESLANDVVSAVFEDRQGLLWVATYDGLQVFDRASESFERSEHFPRIFIQSLFEDQFGVLWAGSDRGPLFRRPPEGAFEPFPPSQAAPFHLAAMHEDPNGHLWMGTYGRGLYHFDLERRLVARYGKEDGLPNNTILGILPDESGNLWLATNCGLVCFNPQTETFETFDVDDGLQSNVFSSNSSFLGKGGELFFGGVQGLNAFRPSEVERNLQPPTVVLTDFQLFDQSVPLRTMDPNSPLAQTISETQEVVLTHRDYVFTLEFAALHFKNPRKNRYTYRLEGFEDEWIETDASRRSVRYSNLAPGNYRFQVKASNADGVWNEEGAQLGITVLPPPWRAWWAYLLYASGATFVLFVGWRSVTFMNRRLESAVEERTARIEELNTELKARNEELENFTYTVSHDLKSPLITIQGFLGLLRQDLADGNVERVENDCHRISRAASNMQQLLNDLLELSRIGRLTNPPKHVPLDELIQESLEFLAGPLADRAVEVSVETGLPTVFGDRVRLREVVQNLLENAIKYMGDQANPRIEVGTVPREGEPTYFVRDNGVGIPPEQQERIFGLFQQLNPKNKGTGIGLALVQRIVEFHGGRVWAESDGVGRGSTFFFTISGAPDESPA